MLSPRASCRCSWRSTLPECPASRFAACPLPAQLAPANRRPPSARLPRSSNAAQPASATWLRHLGGVAALLLREFVDERVVGHRGRLARLHHTGPGALFRVLHLLDQVVDQFACV